MQQQPLDLLSADDRRELEVLLAIIHSDTLSAAAKLERVADVLRKYGVLIDAPSTVHTWTASDIAMELGASAQAIGRLSSKHDLKQAAFGEWRLTHTRSGKQIETFHYNAAGRARLLELMEPPDD